MKKTLSILLVLLLMLPLLVSPVGASAAVELEMMIWFAEQEEAVKASVEAFNKSQNEIHVNCNLVPWGQYWDKLKIALPAGNAPDVFAINALNVRDFADKGYLLNITDLFESGKVDVNKFPKHVVGTHTRNGVLWGVPKDYDSIAVYYNKDLFDAAGVAYPKDDWTWDQFVETAVKLTDSEKGIYGAGVRAAGQQSGYDFIFGNGGKLFDENGKCVVNSPENIEAMQKLVDLIHVHKCNPTIEEQTEVSVHDRFLSGTVAMIFQGSWNLGLYAETFGDRVDAVALPTMKEKKTISHCLSYVAAASTKYPEEVKKVLAYLGTYDAQVMTAARVIPAFEGCDKVWAEKYAAYNTHAFTGAVSENWAVPLPAAEKNTFEIFTRFNDYMADMFATNEVAANMEKMEKEFNDLLQ